MRSLWNAGAALAVTGMLTLTASLISGSGYPALAQSAVFLATPDPALELVADGTHRHYTGLAEHFRAANTSSDGKLTMDQARQAGWSRVIRHFADIDTTRSGFVTLAQIHSYNLAHRHVHHSA